MKDKEFETMLNGNLRQIYDEWHEAYNIWHGGEYDEPIPYYHVVLNTPMLPFYIEFHVDEDCNYIFVGCYDHDLEDLSYLVDGEYHAEVPGYAKDNYDDTLDAILKIINKYLDIYLDQLQAKI